MNRSVDAGSLPGKLKAASRQPLADS